MRQSLSNLLQGFDSRLQGNQEWYHYLSGIKASLVLHADDFDLQYVISVIILSCAEGFFDLAVRMSSF